MNREEDEEVELYLARAKGGVRMVTGTVTDASQFPPLIDLGDGVAVATPCHRGYRPRNNDFVEVMTDWDGDYSAVRFCLGRIAACGGLELNRSANQSATGGASTAISWDAEALDQGWLFTPHATTATTITVPTGGGGIFAISCEVVGAGNWAIGSTCEIRAPHNTRSYLFDRARAGARLAGSVTVHLAGGDTVLVQVFNNGSTQNMTAHLEVCPVA